MEKKRVSGGRIEAVDSSLRSLHSPSKGPFRARKKEGLRDAGEKWECAVHAEI